MSAIGGISLGGTGLGFSLDGQSNGYSGSSKIKRLEQQIDVTESKLEKAKIQDRQEEISRLERELNTKQTELDALKTNNSSDKTGVSGKRNFDSFECETCKNRRYQDGSNDPGVSYKAPTKISPQAAESAVRSHEAEHVTRNRAKAEREGSEIVSQHVAIHHAVCPECGKVYVSGGTTTTVTRSGGKTDTKYDVGIDKGTNGSALDKTA